VRAPRIDTRGAGRQAARLAQAFTLAKLCPLPGTEHALAFGG